MTLLYARLEKEAQAMLDSGHRISIASTGAGAGLQKHLWDVPGISKVLVGAEFPYASEATDRFLGYTPDQYCSEKTAVALAMEAYYRAWKPGVLPALGLGLTASVASTTAHRGDHRVHAAVVTESRTWLVSGVLSKGEGPERRILDGQLCDALGLWLLLDATHRPVAKDSLLSMFQVGTHAKGHDCYELPLGTFTEFKETLANDLAMQVLLDRPFFTTSGKRQTPPTNGNGLTLFPGAFNPPHEGHLWMAKEHSATFHITINPPHKPALTGAEALQRAKHLEGHNVLFTVDDPLYIDKARRFPGSRILTGVDAIERMLDPKWGVPIEPMFSEFRRLGVRFLVADREMDGRIMTLHDLKDAPVDICQRVLRPAQHLNLSSTKLREVHVP